MDIDGQTEQEYTTNLIGLKKLQEDLVQLSANAATQGAVHRGVVGEQYNKGIAHAYKKAAEWLDNQIKLIEDLNK